MSEIPDVPEPAIPDAPMSGGMPPWAMMGVQLLDALVQRLKGDDQGGSPDRPAAGWQPSPSGPPPPRSDARLERTCRVLSRHNERLAWALGACRCWGLSPDCRRCGGIGVPGSLDVDPGAFAELVLPLVQAQPELFLPHLSHAVDVVPEQ